MQWGRVCARGGGSKHQRITPPSQQRPVLSDGEQTSDGTEGCRMSAGALSCSGKGSVAQEAVCRHGVVAAHASARAKTGTPTHHDHTRRGGGGRERGSRSRHNTHATDGQHAAERTEVAGRTGVGAGAVRVQWGRVCARGGGSKHQRITPPSQQRPVLSDGEQTSDGTEGCRMSASALSCSGRGGGTQEAASAQCNATSQGGA